MIANARMYSVSPEVGALWRRLLAAVSEQAAMRVEVIDYEAPAPLEALWQRKDLAAVFMCGLPYACRAPRPALVAAPVPADPESGGSPLYCSVFVVRHESPFHSVEDTFGSRVAFTAPDSQSGYAAALSYLMAFGDRTPLFREIVAPQITPLGAAAAVLSGVADVAPIDSYAFALLQRHRHDLTSQLRVIARTAHTPIPVLISTVGPLGALQSALLDAHDAPETRPLMQELLLQRFAHPNPSCYDAVADNFRKSRLFWQASPLASVVHPAFLV